MCGLLSFRKERKYEAHTKTYELDADAFEFITVRTEDDIVAAVKRAKENGLGIRAMGSKYSWENIVPPLKSVARKNIILDMRNYDQAINIDREKLRACVQGGMQVKNFSILLDSYGLAMADLGNVDGQTLEFRLSRMWIVNGNAEVVEIDMTDTKSPLTAAAGVSLGLLGVISSVEFIVVPAFDIREDFRLMPFDTLMSSLDLMLEKGDFFQAEYFVRNETFRVDCSMKVPQRLENRREGNTSVELLKIGPSKMKAARAAQWALSYVRVPVIEKRIVEKMSMLEKVIELPSYDALCNGRSLKIDHIEMDVVIPLSQFPAFMTEVRALFRTLSGRAYPAYPLDVRITRGDQFYLSSGYGMEMVAWIDFMAPFFPKAGKPFRGRNMHQKFFSALQPLVENYSGRYHWGKVNTAGKIAEIEMLDEFKAVRKEMDPDSIFFQSHFDALLDGKPTPTALVNTSAA